MGIGGSKLGGKQQVDHVTEGDETTFFAQKESPIMVSLAPDSPPRAGTARSPPFHRSASHL